MCVLSPEAAINVKKVSRGSLATEKPGCWGVRGAGAGHRWDKCAPPLGIHSSRVWPFTFYLALCPRLTLIWKYLRAVPGRKAEALFVNATVTPEMTFGLWGNIILGQLWFAAILSGEAGRPGHRERAYVCLSLCCCPDMCYFLLAQPTCSAKALHTNASLQQQNVSAWTDQAHPSQSSLKSFELMLWNQILFLCIQISQKIRCLV